MQSYALEAEIQSQFLAVINDSDLPGAVRRSLVEDLTVNVTELTYKSLKFWQSYITVDYDHLIRFVAEESGDDYVVTMEFNRTPEWSGAKLPALTETIRVVQPYGFFSVINVANLMATMLVKQFLKVGV